MPLRPEPPERAELVLVLAPIGRDADVVADVLHGAGMKTERCADVPALCRAIAASAGAALVAEEALSPEAIGALNAALAAQAPWSDLPIVLATGVGEHQAARERTVRRLDPAGNVTILERPFRKLTLITAFEAALRARRRQYQMREMMARLVAAEHDRAEAEALRRSEVLYRTLARNYPDGAVLLLDGKLACTLAEGRGLPALGLSREAAEGRPLAQIFPEAVAARVEPSARAALAGRTTSDEVEHKGRIHHVRCVPLPGPRGEIEGVLVATHDVTDQKRIEEELRRDGELRERFMGVLAHDLRTPLQAVAFTADKLGKTLPAVAGRDADRIGRAADRMARMIRDLLDLTRGRLASGIPVAPRAADLAAICRRAVEELRAAHPERQIVLSVRGDAQGTWDADRLTQVASNLVDNALAYSPPDTPISVDVRGEGGHVVLAVKNFGAPIPPEAMSRIFAPFSRGNHDGERAKVGLGLGLFIVHRIVEAHGGAVTLASSAEDGTVFTVSLPRATPDRPAVPEPAATGAAAEGDRRLVLIAEDDDDIRDVIGDVLEVAGYDVVAARNGREALDMLARGLRPCLILLDLMMPVMSGWELLDALRADGDLERLPVVILSAAADGSTPLPGARQWLPKPFHVPMLLAAVAQHCTPRAA
jgi:PAS domain S-box-containing protein